MSTAETTTQRSVPGALLYERRVGTGPPVVVLHGGPGASFDYLLPGFDALADGRTLIYYDQRGGGRSPIPRDQPVGWRDHVADLEALRAVWGVERLTILGYSWGGLLAQLYAIEHRERVERLALVCPAPSWRAARDEFERRFSARNMAPEVQAERQRLRNSDLRVRDPEAFQRRMFELSVVAYFHDPEQARNLTAFRVVGRIQQETWGSLGDYDLRPELDRLRGTPALVVHGASDPIPLEASEETAARIRATLEVLDRCGHCPHVERPDRFVPLLHRFLPHV
ncbi:MAG TPA: alpha/beta fold hydrolase [Gemmatimonadales bacterium]|nr:alpha/beta fold hydrolase [Gemmatimonadales bacterium]